MVSERGFSDHKFTSFYLIFQNIACKFTKYIKFLINHHSNEAQFIQWQHYDFSQL